MVRLSQKQVRKLQASGAVLIFSKSKRLLRAASGPVEATLRAAGIGTPLP
jgi:hypothetical protein